MTGRANPRSLRTVLNYLRGRYPGVSLQQFRYCLRHGFYPERALEYNFTAYRPQDYFPDSSRGSPGSTLDPAEVACCRDKVVFALHMREIGANTPRVLAEHAGGRLIIYDDDARDFDALLLAQGELVVKPRGNFGGGAGVRIVRHGDTDAAPRAGEFAAPRIRQHEYADTICPYSANTIRVLTAWDYDRQDIFIAAAMHRFGFSRAARVDNWSQGGLAVGIDLESGRLGTGIRKPTVDASRARYKAHPETGAQIEGVLIPRFAEMCADLLRVARRFPRRYVGWDIVMTPENWTYLEANSVPALSLFQFHRPVLLDPRLRTYYTREGVM